MDQETVKVTVTFGKQKAVFHLNLISVAEEQKLRQKFLGLSDEERAAKSFALNVSALTEFEAAPIELTTKEADGEQTSEISAKEYFASESVSKARIAEYAVRGFLLSIQPSVDF